MDQGTADPELDVSQRARRRARLGASVFALVGVIAGLYSMVRGLSLATDVGAVFPALQRFAFGAGTLLVGLGLGSEGFGAPPGRVYRWIAAGLLTVGAVMSFFCERPGC